MTPRRRPWTLPAPRTAQNRRPPCVGKRSRVFHKRPPAIMSEEHQHGRKARGRLRAAAGMR